MRSHIQNAIGIDLKGDLNLRDATSCRWDACQVKLTQLVVVLGHGTLTLIHLQRQCMFSTLRQNHSNML